MVVGGAIAHGPKSWTFSSLLVGSNSFITHLPTQNLSFFISNNATIQAGGGIVANSQGYAGGSGPGAGAPLFHLLVSLEVALGMVAMVARTSRTQAAESPMAQLPNLSILAVVAARGPAIFQTIAGAPAEAASN